MMESLRTSPQIMRYCSVRLCRNFHGTTDPGYQFFSCKPQSALEKSWELALTGRADGKVGHVCSLHFRPEDVYTINGRMSLKLGAVPVLHISQHTQKNVIPAATPRDELKLVDIDAIKNNAKNVSKVIENKSSTQQSTFCTSCVQKDVNLQAAKMKIAALTAKTKELMNEIRELKVAQRHRENLTNRQDLLDMIIKEEPVEIPSLDESTSESVCVPDESLLNVSIKEEIENEVIELIEPPTSSGEVRVKNVPNNSIASRVDNFKCDKCDMEFDDSLMLCNHRCIVDAKMKLFKCGKCGASFEQPSKLGTHMRSEHPSETEIRFSRKLFKCGKCGSQFEHAMELNKHIREKHTEQKRFQCYLCKKELDSLEAVRVHMRKQHAKNFKCEVCKVSLTLRELNRHMCGNEKSINCEYCEKSFTTIVRLLRHLKKHDKQRLYACGKCSRFLPMNTLKDFHMKIHSQDKPKLFACTKCPKAFASKCGLRIHARSHNTQKPYLCEECGKGFKTDRNLQLHKQSGIHSTVPTISCPHCPHKFFREQDLKRHSEVHQPRRTYICDICGAELKSLLSFNCHKNRHKRKTAGRQYGCSLCPMKFYDAKNLRHHEIVHKGNREHSCQHCEASGQPRSFKYKGDLIKHLRSHTEDGKIYACEKCPERFLYRNELQQHEYVHYKEEKKN